MKLPGTIVSVDEENAFIYLKCGNCKSDKVQEIAGGLVDCSHCGQRSTVPGKGYSLEVWLDCGPDLHCAGVKVKVCVNLNYFRNKSFRTSLLGV